MKRITTPAPPAATALVTDAWDAVGARRVCRNVKHWRDAAMALRWTGAAMLEAAKGFRRLKAHRQLPTLKAALAAHGARHTIKPVLERQTAAA